MKQCLLILTFALMATGCTSRTEFGDCVGIGDEQDPKLKYKVSLSNAVLGIVFFELVVPPLDVLINKTHCPVGVKEVKQ